VIESWKQLHNEELDNLYSSPNIIRMVESMIRWAGHAACIGKERNPYWTLVGEREGTRSLGRRRWVDNIKMDLRETGCGGMDVIHLVQDRDQWRALVNTVMNNKILINP
jgi:hypothetical protein